MSCQFSSNLYLTLIALSKDCNCQSVTAVTYYEKCSWHIFYRVCDFWPFDPSVVAPSGSLIFNHISDSWHTYILILMNAA